jgi:hypothetical protein
MTMTTTRPPAGRATSEAGGQAAGWTTAAEATRSRSRAVPPSGDRTAARSGKTAPRSRFDTASNYEVAGTSALAPDRVPARAPTRRGTRTAEPARLRVAPPVPVRAPRAPFVLLVLSVVIGGVLGILVLNTKINENAFRLQDLQNQQVALDQRQQQLSDDLAQRESPNSLAAQARRLGLVRADNPAYIHVPDGRVAGQPTPALGTPSVTGGQNAPSDTGTPSAPGGTASQPAD